jgi:hypothetical protein
MAGVFHGHWGPPSRVKERKGEEGVHAVVWEGENRQEVEQDSQMQPKMEVGGRFSLITCGFPRWCPKERKERGRSSAVLGRGAREC